MKDNHGNFPSKEEFDKLAETILPNPYNIKTDEIIRSNGFKSVIKKEDGTYFIKDETTGCEAGSFLREEDALNSYYDLISEK